MQDINAQLAALEAELHQKQAQIALLEADLAALEAELIAFKADYDRVVQPAATKLEAARAAVEQLEREIFLRSLAEDSRSRDAAWTPPPNYVSVEEQYRRVWQAQAAPSPRDVNAPHLKELPERPKANADPRSKEAQLKQLYRQLVRRYHPDLAAEHDRAARNQLMVLINDAYAQHDLTALQLVAQHLDAGHVDETLIDVTAPLAALHLRALQTALGEADQRLATLEREHHNLLHSDLMDLKLEVKLAQAAGRDRLKEIADALDQDYWAYQKRLDHLRGAK